ncbi:MAG TPA: hypothetical protein VJ762_01050 [Sphingobium sp.]|nr:hypothetical protein [Sphingobium sp.]
MSVTPVYNGLGRFEGDRIRWIDNDRELLNGNIARKCLILRLERVKGIEPSS